MTIRRELIDELLEECSDPKQLLIEGGFLKQLIGALIERCLEAEMEEHLGYPKHGKRNEEHSNVRNGRSRLWGRYCCSQGNAIRSSEGRTVYLQKEYGEYLMHLCLNQKKMQDAETWQVLLSHVRSGLG